jgi:hypothetical protein
MRRRGGLHQDRVPTQHVKDNKWYFQTRKISLTLRVWTTNLSQC